MPLKLRLHAGVVLLLDVASLRSAERLRIAWTAIEAAAGRHSWALLDVALPILLLLGNYQHFPPPLGCMPQAAFQGALGWGFLPVIRFSRAPTLPTERTPRFPLLQTQACSPLQGNSRRCVGRTFAKFTFHVWVSGTESKHAFLRTILESAERR